MSVIAEVYTALIDFQMAKKDAAIRAQTIPTAAVLAALPSTPEGKEHFCMVTICSSYCASVWRGEFHRPLSWACHPKTSLDSQLGVIHLDHRNREEVQQQEEGQSKG